MARDVGVSCICDIHYDGQVPVPMKRGDTDLVCSRKRVAQPQKADEQCDAYAAIETAEGQEDTPLTALCVGAMGVALLAAALNAL